MLREIFKSHPLPYATAGSVWDFSGRPGTIWDVDYHANKLPYLESVQWVSGIFTSPSPWPHPNSSPEGASNILVFAVFATKWWPSWGFGYYRLDPVSGKVLSRMWMDTGVGEMMVYSTTTYQSRGGKFYFRHIWSSSILEVNLGHTATELMFGEPTTPSTILVVYPPIYADRFTNLGGYFGHPIAIDDVPSVDPYDPTKSKTYMLMSRGNRWMGVWNWATGAWIYDLEFPAAIVDIALEETGRAYILLNTRQIVLFDYLRNEILGMSMIPKERKVTGGVRISWDVMYKRLLFFEQTPDAENGASTLVVRGFRMVPTPSRLTKPIPLLKPKQGRIVPFLVQVVGEANEGIGGYQIEATVSGAGSLVGVPLSNHGGDAHIHVACEGSAYGSPEPDWSTTGSPDPTSPSAGDIFIEAKAVLPQEIGEKLRPVNVASIEGKPGDPLQLPLTDTGEAGGGAGFGPNEMPNMFYILEQVYATQTWRLAEPYEDYPDGRGMFTEKCVQAMHDKDARFGHYDKRPGGNSYNGHSVDAVCFKNDDGVSQEGADIVGGDGKLMWGVYPREARVPDGEKGSWVYPVSG